MGPVIIVTLISMNMLIKSLISIYEDKVFLNSMFIVILHASIISRRLLVILAGLLVGHMNYIKSV